MTPPTANGRTWVCPTCGKAYATLTPEGQWCASGHPACLVVAAVTARLLSAAELAAIGERVAAATVGPWLITREELSEDFDDEEQEHAFPATIGPIDAWEHAATNSGEPNEFEQIEADAAFIAHSRTDVPALLGHIVAEHAAALEKIRGLEAERDGARSQVALLLAERDRAAGGEP